MAYLGLATDPKVTWAIIPMAFWSIVEQGVSITCIAMATLKPLFVRIGIIDPRDQTPVRLPTNDVFGQMDVENVVMQESSGSGSNGGRSGVSGSQGSGDWSGNGTTTLLAGKRGWREKVRVKVKGRGTSNGNGNGNGNRNP
jgi:hypothetical protein